MCIFISGKVIICCSGKMSHIASVQQISIERKKEESFVPVPDLLILNELVLKRLKRGEENDCMPA